MKRTSLFLSERQLVALQALALHVGISMAELIRRLLDEGLQRTQQRQEPKQ